MNRRDLAKGAAAFATAGAGLSASSLLAANRFRVLPEDHPHEATIMMWPTSPKVHPDRAFLTILQATIANIANTIAAFEDVILLAHQDDHAAARKRLSGKVRLWNIPTEDLWSRDAGPIVVSDGSRRAVSHIAFNGWGRRQVHKRDGEIAALVAERMGFDLMPTGLRGEAGGVEQDGHGTLLAHESSWVNANRNPGLSKNQIAERLLLAYGADRIIWSPGVSGQDITDYHIDSLARFTAANRLLLCMPDRIDRSDPFHRAAVQTRNACQQAGLEVDIILEPRNRRVRSLDFVASYANYYVCNGAVIASEFGDKTADKAAQTALARHYPDRQIVMLNADALGEVGGGIHCATHEVPLA